MSKLKIVVCRVGAAPVVEEIDLPNRLVANTTPIHGDFFIVGHDAEGETVGLTDAQCAEWLAKANSWPAAINLPQGD